MTHEVMIQDVNSLNASIYFDGYMYVGGRRHVPSPAYFAPYFTEKCAADARLPRVVAAGISVYSKVFTVIERPVKDVLSSVMALNIDAGIQNHKHWPRWQTGLRAIVARAKSEHTAIGGWSEDNDPHRLYFLGDPIPLERTLTKSPRFPRIPWGFGMSLDRLKSVRGLP